MLARRQSTRSPTPYEVPPSWQWDGNDGIWSTFVISVGTPGQEFRVLPSTAGSETLIPLSGCCLPTEPTTCPSLRGVNLFNGFPSVGFSTNQSSTWKQTGSYDVGLDTQLGYTVGALYGSDTVALEQPGNASATFVQPLSLNSQTVAGMVDKRWFLGILGINTRPSSFSSSEVPVPSLLQNLRNQTLIPSLSYAYTAGAGYPERMAVGSLVLGGYGQSRFTPTNLTIDFAAKDYAAPVAGVLSIIGTNTLQGVVSFTTSGAFLVAIDTSVPEMWLPRPVCDAFEEALGLTYDGDTDRYKVNSTIHSQLTILNPSFTFRLDNNTTPSGNSTDIVLPYAAFDLQASWPIYNTSTNYFPLRRAANASQYTLGRAFLQEAYLIVDFERQNFTITQARFPDTCTPTKIIPIASLMEEVNHYNRLGTGGIVGIIVGGTALLLIVIGSTLFFYHRRRNSRRESKEQWHEKRQIGSNELDSGAKMEIGSTDLPNELGADERQEMAADETGQELDSCVVTRSDADIRSIYEME